jgi:hypothetical protein
MRSHAEKSKSHFDVPSPAIRTPLDAWVTDGLILRQAGKGRVARFV